MIKVVKIGGNVVENDASLLEFCKSFAQTEGPKILVHGGGVMASEIQKQLGQEPRMIEGRRVTDEKSLKVVTMVYSGWCNKHICALLQSLGCNALGLSGCDASVVTASKRKPIYLKDGVTLQDYGYVGDVTKTSVNRQFLETLLSNGITPVLCAINHDGKGNLLNTNADTVAQSLAAAMEGELICCFELPGVLADKNDSGSVIPVIDSAVFNKMKDEGSIEGGMIPKLDNCLKALKEGAKGAVIKSYAALNDNSGTTVKL